MKPKKVLYKQMVWFMLDQQFTSKEIYQRLECSQAVVSRAKTEWDKMGASQQKKIPQEIRELLGSQAKKYENPNRKEPKKEKEPEKMKPGFNTPYSAMRKGRSVISRY